MGYTHYWAYPPSHPRYAKAWPRLVQDTRVILDRIQRAGITIAGPAGHGEAILNQRTRIAFNAALGLLADAVRAGNNLLRRLEKFTAPYLTAAIHELERTVVEGQGETTDCGCGWPITVYDDEWMHVYNPRLTGSDDHDPRP